MPVKQEVSPSTGSNGIVFRPKTELQSGLSESTSALSAPDPDISYSSTLQVEPDPIAKKRSGTVSSGLPARHLLGAPSIRVQETSTTSVPQTRTKSGIVSPQSFGTALICCDVCPRWYHLACARVSVDDPRVSDPGVEFICDTCADIRLIPRKPGLHLFPIEPGVCALRTCARPIRLPGEYFVERIIGHRFLRAAENPDIIFEEFLVKWEDYPADRATWKRQDQIGELSSKFINEFETMAQYKWSSGCSGSVVYLQEALDAGWC